MPNQRQKLTLLMESKSKTWAGYYEVSVLINGKRYTYFITSEFALRKAERFIAKSYYGKAIALLKKFNIKGDEKWTLNK